MCKTRVALGVAGDYFRVAHATLLDLPPTFPGILDGDDSAKLHYSDVLSRYLMQEKKMAVT